MKAWYFQILIFRDNINKSIYFTNFYSGMFKTLWSLHKGFKNLPDMLLLLHQEEFLGQRLVLGQRQPEEGEEREDLSLRKLLS